MPERTNWTVLTYIAAHNDLHLLGDRSLDQIIATGSTASVMHGVLFDGIAGAARYVVGDPGLVIQQERFNEFDAGDPARLVETANWLFSQYPADHYGLILWSHGTGWAPKEIERAYRQVHGDTPPANEGAERAALPGSLTLFRTSLQTMLQPSERIERAILFDDGSGHALDTIQLGQVAGEIAGKIGQKLDLLGMDACLMASIEVGYQLRDAVACLVASEDLVPGLSWPYNHILPQLRANPEMSPRDLARCIVDAYVGFYRERPPAANAGEVTKIALDLEHIDDVVAALAHLADALIAALPAALPCLEHAQISTWERETLDGQRGTSRFDYHLWDIVAVARELAGCHDDETVGVAADRVHQMLDRSGLVIRKDHLGSWFDRTGGLSVYWIPPKQGQPRQISPFYHDVDFAQATNWDAMLRAYRYL
jgi:hypothetical protein